MWRLRTGRSIVAGRSECENCHHRLGALDLVPVVSWLVLRGACRHCGARISPAAPALEAGLAGLFVLSYLCWPLGFDRPAALGSFGLWLVYLVVLAALVAYDLRWMVLPDRLVLPLIVLALVDAALRISVTSAFTLGGYTRHVLGGTAALAGVYLLLYITSRGRLVGLGDIKLCLFAGIVLGWPGALLTLGLSNVLGALVVLPALATGALTRKSRIPFGPFLAAGFVIAGLVVPG